MALTRDGKGVGLEQHSMPNQQALVLVEELGKDLGHIAEATRMKPAIPRNETGADGAQP